MNIKIFLLPILFFLVFTACQKELSHESGNTPTPPLPVGLDSNYLSKIYYIDSTSTLVDTSDIWIYAYDNHKRVVSFTDSIKSLPLVPEQYIYFYNAADTLPYKSIYYNRGIIDADTSETWHNYDNTGNRINDSVIKHRNFAGTTSAYSEINTYSYVAGKIYGHSVPTLIYSIGGNIQLAIKMDTATLDAFGNIILNKKHTYAIPGGAQTDLIVSTATYDNHPSPYAKLSNFKCFDKFPVGETFPENFPQANNLFHMHEVTTGTNPFLFDGDDFTGYYHYRADGYPSQIRIPDPLNPSHVFKIVFTYRAF